MRRPHWISLGLFLLAAGLPLATHAALGTFAGQIIPQVCNCPGSAADWGCVLQTIQSFMNFSVYIATIIITLFIALAGFTYMTSGGSAEKRSLANKRVANAVIGLVIVLVAWLLVDSVMKVLYKSDAGFGPWNAILASNNAPDCIVKNGKPPPLVGPDSSTQNAAGGGVGTVTGTPGVPSTPSQNARGDCSATALQGTFGSNAAAMSCVTTYEDSSCNTGLPSGTDIGADGNSVSFGLFQVNISANNLSQFPACTAAAGTGSLNCTQAFSGGAYTGSNHNTRVSDAGLYAQCKRAITSASCNEQAAQTILQKQGLKAWGNAAQNNCSSLYHR